MNEVLFHIHATHLSLHTDRKDLADAQKDVTWISNLIDRFEYIFKDGLREYDRLAIIGTAYRDAFSRGRLHAMQELNIEGKLTWREVEEGQNILRAWVAAHT